MGSHCHETFHATGSIFNLVPSLPHQIPLSVGDTLQLEEESSGWREQYKLSDQSCIYIAEEVNDIPGVARNKIHAQVRNAFVDNIEEDQVHDLFEKSGLEYAFEHFSNAKRLNSYVKLDYDFVEPI
ncbi:hypothetical protein HOLleu_00664 [Holothuria leucospilota]|uniref:Uncharacterized protein n=1 Tax=Holothuria leucospilota TaxID=206669 RepID=A0A9Q1CPZ2_HOLLE|nr:hypothetical protein HOLleu_00664 [Holothuria leucospilota]